MPLSVCNPATSIAYLVLCSLTILYALVYDVHKCTIEWYMFRCSEGVTCGSHVSCREKDHTPFFWAIPTFLVSNINC